MVIPIRVKSPAKSQRCAQRGIFRKVHEGQCCWILKCGDVGSRAQMQKVREVGKLNEIIKEACKKFKTAIR